MGNSFVTGAKNLGSLYGKAAFFGWNLGTTIAVGLTTGGIGLLATLPSLITSTTSFAMTLGDAIDQGFDLQGDWNKTQSDLISSATKDVQNAIESIAPDKQAERALARANNVAYRGSGITPPSQIAKITQPVKHVASLSNHVGQSARVGLQMMDSNAIGNQLR